MTNKEMIIKVLSETTRILDHSGWSRYALARDANGRSCSIGSSEAVSYCLCGALVKAARAIDDANQDGHHKYFQKKLADFLLENYQYNQTFTQWNDRAATSKDDVIKLLHDVLETIRAE
jgi:hypothetical protein